MTDPRKLRDSKRKRLELNPRPSSNWCKGFVIPTKLTDIDSVEVDRMKSIIMAHGHRAIYRIKSRSE
jgi:hypothetical protein